MLIIKLYFMLDSKFFQSLLTKYIKYGQSRHRLLKASSDLLRFSKQVIFSLHRDSLNEAKELLEKAEKLIKDLTKEAPSFFEQGFMKAAIEEYVEAKFFYQYLTNEKIGLLKQIPDHSHEVYLGGLSDLTGELVRRAVLLASDGKYKEIKKIRNFIEEIVEGLIQFDLTGKLRTKYDDAKRNLKRIEGIIYDLHIQKIKING